MRIDRLYLVNYKNLKEFEVDFDISSSRQVVIGRNGVGKSNLMDAMAQIFRDLDLEEDSNFEYEIETTTAVGYDEKNGLMLVGYKKLNIAANAGGIIRIKIAPEPMLIDNIDLDGVPIHIIVN